MDRSRESRKVPMAAPASLTRRRHRGSGLRDSPDEDGTMELQETARLRDRKKERERERERDRDRERSSRNKRRRADRLMHAGNRDDGPDESTDESVNDDEEEDYDEDLGGGGSLRMPPPNPSSTSSPSLSNHHRKSVPQSVPSTKMFRPASPWKPADEMIGVPIPRKARSASTKRAHDCWASGSAGIIGGDQLHRQASTSPARSSLVSATASPSRISPPSSNISARKKMKLIGSNKHRATPKASTSKAASSNQEEIEFEIAQVLYGMMTQPTDATKSEGGVNEALNKSASDSKSRVSSPVSAAPPNQSTNLPGSSAIVVTVPKRKRPRPVNYGDENLGFSSRENIIPKIDVEQVVKAEQKSTILEKNFKPVLADDRLSPDLEHAREESCAKLTKPVRNSQPESNNLRAEEVIVAGLNDGDAISSKRDSTADRVDENSQDNYIEKASGLGIKREEKFQIDLMAPPPALRLSPERDGNIQYVSSEPKKTIPDIQELKPVVKDAENSKQAAADSRKSAESDLKRFKRGVTEETDVHKAYLSKERSVKLQLNTTEKNEGEIGMANACSNRQHVHNQHQLGQPPLPMVATGDEAAGDKTVHAAISLPSGMSSAGWHGGLPPFSYMTPLQGVVSMDGSTQSSTPLQPPQLLLNQPQPRPKRCATHCYIARSISYHQQFTRMNPFWPAVAGSAATLYGANACNLNVVPPVELHGATGVMGVNPVLDKSIGVFPSSKEKPSHGPIIADTAQRKQILLQQAVPAGVSSNLLRGPAFIFPLGQQQAAVAASATTTMKNLPVAGALPTGNPSSGPGNVPSAPSATMSVNYPNMAANETQYLAILQNNPYPFPFPTHAGAPPVYRGAHPQAMPFFNGTFYSPQMLHPSQLQQQSQQSAHGHQILPGPNMGVSSGSSSSQKHLPNHSQKSQGNGSSAGIVNMKQSFPSPKNRPSHMPLKQHNQHLTETGSEDSPSTADSRGSRSNFGMYTENLNLPNHAQNFALMPASSVSVGGGTATTNGGTNGTHHKYGNHSEKKPHQPQQGLKVGVDSLPSHQGFAVSFASLNGSGGPPALDITSMGPNHAILQNFPDAARHHSYQVMVAQQAQQKKYFRQSEEEKKPSDGDALNVEEERKSMASKGVLSNNGLSIAFSRSDFTDSSVPGNNVVDSSSRNLKVASGPGRISGPLLSTSMSNANSPIVLQQKMQLQHQQQQQQQQQQKAQLMQHQKQSQQYTAQAARGKTPSMNNGHLYSDQLPTNAAMAAKLSTFQQNNVSISGGSNSPTQQWKSSARTSVSQVPSPGLAPTNSASGKNIYQQQSQLSQQSHMQISFGGGHSKSMSAAQVQQLPTGHQNPSQIVGGSAAASSNYKGSGSPRTTTAGVVTNKAPQTSTLSTSASLQVKNSSMPSRSSSPVGGRTVPSALGNSNMGTPQGNTSSKPQMFQQQQMKPQLSKQAMQQAQALFPSYLQTSQGPNLTSSTTSLTAANGGSYLQRRKLDTQSHQQSQSPSGSSSTGMLSMCSSTVAVTSDPAKAIAVAGNNIKAPSK